MATTSKITQFSFDRSARSIAQFVISQYKNDQLRSASNVFEYFGFLRFVRTSGSLTLENLTDVYEASLASYDRYPTNHRCLGCSAFVGSFRDSKEHALYHTLLTKHVAREIYGFLPPTYDYRLSSETQQYFTVRDREINHSLHRRDEYCPHCFVKNSHFTVDQHRLIHMRINDPARNNKCYRCGIHLRTDLDALTHFWNHKEAAGFRSFYRVPLAQSECDINAANNIQMDGRTVLETVSHGPDSLAFSKHAGLRAKVWREYKKQCEAIHMRKSDSAMLLDTVKCNVLLKEARATLDGLKGELNDGIFSMIRELSRITSKATKPPTMTATGDWVDGKGKPISDLSAYLHGTDDDSVDVEAQALFELNMFRFTYDLIPPVLADSFAKVVDAILADTRNWMKTILTFVKKYWKVFGLLAVLIGVFLIFKLADLPLFGTKTKMTALAGVVIVLTMTKDTSIDVIVEKVNDILDAQFVEEEAFRALQLIKHDGDSPGVVGQAGIVTDAECIVKLFATCLGFTPSVEAVKTFMSFSNVSFSIMKCMQSWTYIFEFCRKHAANIIEWFGAKDAERTLLNFKGFENVTKEWIAEIAALDTIEKRIELNYDESVQARAYKVRDTGIMLLSEATKRTDQAIRSAVNVMLKTARELAAMAEKAKGNHDMRIDPFCISIFGKPRIGKSSHFNVFANDILEEYDARKTNRVFTTHSHAKHFDGYSQQPIFEIDDFKAIGGQSSFDAVEQFMLAKSSAIFCPPMAHLDAKEIHFTSPIIVMIGNEGWPEISHQATTPQAFYERRNSHWNIFLRPQFEGMSLLQIGYDIVSKHDHVFYQRYDPVRIGVAIGEPKTYSQFVKEVKDEMRKYFIVQKKLLIQAGVEVPVILRKLIIDGANDTQVESAEKNDLLSAVIKDAMIDFDADEKNRTGLGCSFGENPDIGFINPVLSWTQEDVDRVKQQLMTDLRTQNKMYNPARSQLLRVCEILKSTASRVKRFLDRYEILRILTAMVGAGAAWISIKRLVECFYGEKPSENEAEAFYASGDARTKPSSRGKVVARQPLRVVSAAARAEGSEDSNTQAIIRDRLPWNLYTIKHVRELGATTMFCTGIRGRCILLPRHFFTGIKINDLIVLSDGEIEHEDRYDPARLFTFENDDENGRVCDVAIYEMGARFPMQKRLDHLFVSERQLHKISSSTGTLVHTLPGFGMSTRGLSVSYGKITPVDAADPIKYSYTKDGEVMRMNLRSGWNYYGETRAGDCGAVLLINNKLIEGKFIGIHVAGKPGAGLGYSELVTREMLNALLDATETGAIKGPDFDDSGILGQGLEMRVSPQGYFTPIGAVLPQYAPRQHEKTDIRPTPIFDKVRQHVTEPSVLTNRDPRNKSGHSPLMMGINKYGRKTVPFDPAVRRYAKAEVGLEMTMPFPRERTINLDMNYVLHGDSTGVNAMNLSSSPGFPWVSMRRGTGKSWLIDNDENGVYTLKPELANAVCVDLDKLTDCQIPNTVWIDCMKDERRKLRKIEEGKTRLFTIAPVHFTVITRIFFIDFINAFQRNKLKSFSAIGIDCESFDWEMFWRRMEEVSNSGFDGDFGCFDGTLFPECMDDCSEIISDWYDDNVDGIRVVIGEREYVWTQQQCRLIRRMIISMIIHTCQLVMNTLYMTHQGMPSGCALTVIINTMVNAMYLRIAFYSLVGRREPGLYNKTVRDGIYGDDNALAVATEMQSMFNFVSVSKFFREHGLEYTPAEKDSEGVAIRPLSELGFLKRKTAWFQNRVRVPQMDKDTIYEMLNWVRAKDDGDVVPQLYSNIRDASWFMFFYGIKAYRSFRFELNQQLERAGLDKSPDFFELFHESFISKIQ